MNKANIHHIFKIFIFLPEKYPSSAIITYLINCPLPAVVNDIFSKCKYYIFSHANILSTSENIVRKMEKNNIIIIALIATIAVLGVCIGYALMNPQVEYETINISNGTTIAVPKTNDASWVSNPNGIRTYSCQSKHTVMMTFNSQEDLNLVGAAAFAMARDALINGSTDVEKYKNYQIKENTVNGTHYYITYISNNETHDNIVIGSENLDILKHMLDSLTLGPPGEGVLNATAEQTQSSNPTPVNKSTNNDDKKKYSEDDLMRAAEEGYYTGYSDGYVDSSYYYDDVDIDSTFDDEDYYYDDSDSGSSSETTTEG